ncbi:MAG: hypothetical protein WB650_18375 [Candidatus Binatus sp.]
MKDAVEKEFREITKLALGAAVQLKLHQGQQKSLLDEIRVEYGWWEGQNLNRAQARRFRCLEAIAKILDPLHIKEIGVGDWIQEIDQCVAVLMRDVSKAAPAPGASLLRVFEMERIAAYAATGR